MTSQFSHGAGGSIAGVLWQVDLGLLRLFAMETRETLQIEALDDLIVLRDTRRLGIAIQTKHSLADSALTSRGTAFWKTLRVWLDVAREHNGPLPVLELATTMAIAPDLSVLEAAPDSRLVPDEEIDRLEHALSEIAREQGNQALLKEHSMWRASTPEQRLEIIRRAHLRGNLASLSELTRDLDGSLVKVGIAPGLVEEARVRLEGWYHDLVRDRLSTAGCSISKDEFLAELQAIHRTASMVVLPFGHAGDPIPDMIMHLEGAKLYQRQLGLIDATQGERAHAYQMFTRARIEREDLLGKTLVALRELQEHESDLVNSWRSKRLTALREMDASDDKAKGHRILDLCSSSSSSIRQTSVPHHVHVGTLHIVADGPRRPRIGWHPGFETLLAGTSDA